MIEIVVLNYLNKSLKVQAFMEEEEKMPEEYVILEKTGGGKENFIYSATFAIQSYANSKLRAAEINEEVKKAMDNIIVLDDVSRSELNSDYPYTDTSRKKHRYQAVYDITHY